MSQEICAGAPAQGTPQSKVEGFDSLVELALDLRSAWNHATDEIWRRLEPALWEMTHNPWVVLQTASADQIARILGDATFRGALNRLIESRRQWSQAPAWFQMHHPSSPLTCVAYFSMEFMLSEALPIYSGGLGNVAGDHLKAASDLGVPIVGVGLLYQRGYFRQAIRRDGTQEALFPYNDPGQLPITPLRHPNGEWLRLEVALPGYSVWLRAWQVQVGRVRLYLLDSNDAANFPVHRGITSELYGGGPELRLQQEMALGIGGWRLLRALGLRPEVCHLNEGHAAFVVLERARSLMEESKLPFRTALAITRAGNHFTTHTAVSAGIDRFPPALIAPYLGQYAETRLGIPLTELLALGRINPLDAEEDFNMACLAIRGSGSVNGVSRLHAQVSRGIFLPLFPRWPETEVPIGHVTNGVHMPTWDSHEADELWTEACGKERWLGTAENMAGQIRSISDENLWRFRTAARAGLVRYARRHLALQLAASGATSQETARALHIFDPNVLTLGFARRFATYKRPNLLLYDPERLLRILSQAHRPVQLIIAGKAHPADEPGQALIRQWVEFIHRPEARPHVIFLSDYDMKLTEHLVQGVDVWINTPRRPWEACGTSGMKVLVNGGLNLSELDGWWAEAWAPDVGWSLGDGMEHDEDPAWDAAEADALYRLLESEVIPQFYTRDAGGIPTAWIARMRESMARLTPRFSANRMVRQYTEEYYLPAATRWRSRIENDWREGQAVVEWIRNLEQSWTSVRFGLMKVETQESSHVFETEVHLNSLPPDAVRVELFAEPSRGEAPVVIPMAPGQELVGSIGVYRFRAAVPATRPASDYTPRVIPSRQGVAVPLECGEILWQR